MSRVLVIIVNYRSAELTLDAVKALQPARDHLEGLRVHVVENDSGDGQRLSTALAGEAYRDWVTLTLAPRNGGFAYGNNIAVRSTLGTAQAPDFYFLLNPDAQVKPGALEALVSFLEENPRAAAVGPKLENADGSEWNYAFRFPNVVAEFEKGLRLSVVSKLLKNYLVARPMGDQPSRVDWLCGAALLIRREVFEKIGLMDEEYFLYYEETDFLLAAARAGFESWHFPGVQVRHLAGQSTGVTSAENAGRRRLPAYWYESRRRFFMKNFGVGYATAADIAYLTGTSLFRLRILFDRKERPRTPYLLQDLLHHFSLWPSNRKVSASKNY